MSSHNSYAVRFSLYSAGLCCLVCLLGAFLPSVAQYSAATPGAIGIFNVRAIHAVSLNPEILKRTEEGNVITEEVRFTSVPGVRVFGYFSYPKGAKKLPTTLVVRYTGAEMRNADAKIGFVGFSVSAPSGNQNTTIQDSIGGVPLAQDFVDDPTQSWVYHHTVALTRALDYLETRPEVDMKRVLVMGYSWGGYITALLHAIDNRPCAYVVWHGSGYYADEQGISGDRPSLLQSRKYYDMYSPSAYAKYGSQPIMLASSLTDYFATLDGLIEMFTKLTSPKLLSVAPNRYHAATGRNEFRGTSMWGFHWQGGGPPAPKVAEGSVAVRDGHLIYSFHVNTLQPTQYVEVLYSYGKPGHWTGRTWHRDKAKKVGLQYECEIPVYNPDVPLYAVAQIEVADYGGVANTPQFIDPRKLGLTQASATYPKSLMDFEDKDTFDLYIANGTPTQVPNGPQGKFAASIVPFHDGTIQFLGLEPFLWDHPTELHMFLKGDGKPGPLDVYLAYDTSYWLDHQRKNYAKITLVNAEETFSAEWKEYVIPLDVVDNLEKIDSMFFDMGTRTLLIDDIRWK